MKKPEYLHELNALRELSLSARGVLKIDLAMAIRYGTNEAIFISYLALAPKDAEGWVSTSVDTIRAESGLRYDQQRVVRRHLTEAHLIEERYEKEIQRMFFRITSEFLAKAVRS